MRSSHAVPLPVGLVLAMLLSSACSNGGPPGGNDAGASDAGTKDAGVQSSCGAPWQDADVGAVGVAGSADCLASGVFALQGAGVDIGGTKDAFHFLYQTLSGDGWIAAHVLTIAAGDPGAKAGLVIRDGLGAGARAAEVLVPNDAASPIQLVTRADTGGATTTVDGASATAPYWLMLVRRGDGFRAYQSTDGQGWSAIGGQTVSMGSDVDVGLAFTSHDDTTLATGIVDDVTLGLAGAPECVTSADCDDANPCTDDACSAGACSHTDNTAACANGTCRAGVCQQSGTPPTYPPDGPLSSYTAPSQPKPGYLQSYTDQTFGTKITRVTDAAAFGLSGPVVRHHYSKDEPWNSDDSLIFIMAGNTLLDDATYQIVGHVTASGELRWANTKPLVMWNVDINAKSLNEITVHPGTPYTTTSKTLATFPSFDKLYMGPWEGNVDDDDHYIAMLGETGSTATAIVWDLKANTEVARLVLPHAFADVDWISMSPSGKYVMVMTANAGTDIYDTDLTGYRHLLSSQGHADMGYDVAGTECLLNFQWSNWPVHSRIFCTPLDGSAQTVEFANPLFRDTCQSHLSMRATQRPGWLYVSVNDNCTGNNGIEKDVFSIRLDGSGAVAGNEVAEQWAQTYSSSASYDRLVFGVPNRDGSKVMFASDWGDPSGEIDSYVAEMP